MRNILLTVLAAGIGVAGPAAPASAGLLSATGAVIAILAGELFVGEAEGHLGGAGTITIHSQKNPALICVGQFTSSVALGGSGQLQCSDGATATFHFQRLSVLRGYGAGDFSRGPMTFTYGIPVEDSGPYLRLPAGKKLTQNGAQLELVDL
ncbi:MAG TPA: hypothetical protein VKS43_08740 [Burkholderiales bacterium]|nr:hypothetical protein [Burkholderiales bacterium]